MGIVIRVTRRRVFVALLAAVILFAGIGSFTVVYTATPESCATCHNMVPFYESWQASVHHEVACVDCHFPPGVEGDMERQLAGLNQVLSYMTTLNAGGGTRMQAQVPDRGCLASGCHERSALRKPLLFGRYVLDFRHDLHFGKLTSGIELKCASCHMRNRPGEHFSVNPETCWTCHFNDPEGGAAKAAPPATTDAVADAGPGAGAAAPASNGRCLECHGMALRLNRDLPEDHTRTLEKGINCQVCHGSMVQGQSPVSASACRRCHVNGQPEELLDDPAPLHEQHTQAVKVDCSECHDVPKHVSRTRLRDEVPSCSSCHPQFHEAQSLLWSGTGFPDVAGEPNPMYPDGLTCEACHTSLTASHGQKAIGETKLTTAESCRVCHASESRGDYAELLGPWIGVSAENVDQVAALYEREKVRLGALPDEGEGSPGRLYREGLRNLELLRAGGPVHNVWYARDVTYAILDRLRRALAAVAPDEPAPTIRDRSAPVPEACLRCHFGVSEDVEAFGQEFSHARHLLDGGVECTTCHSGPDDPHGQTRLSGVGDCSSCHHGAASRDAAGKRSSKRCENCHPLQTSIYEGTWERPRTPKPNVMAADVHCIQCHFPEGSNRPVRPSTDDCRKCHEDGDLAALLPKFREGISNLRQEVERQLAKAEGQEGLAEEDRAFLRHVRRTLDTLEKDGSHGIHNPALVDDVLGGFIEKLKELTGRQP